MTIRLVLAAALASVLLAIAAGAALYAAVPWVEWKMAFHPQKATGRRPPDLLRDATDVRFTTSDGVRLHGWFLDGAAPRNGTTVLMLHGNAGNNDHWAGDAAFLRTRGYDVFLPDYRGYGRSEGETLGEETLALDGAAAMRYLTADRGIDRSAVALFGYSLGTAIATDLAATGPCRALALVAPLASARRHARRVMPALPDFFFDRMRNRFDVAKKVGQANCPVLVVHGTDDEVIPLVDGRTVYEAAREPKRLLVIERGRHWLPASHGHLEEIAAFFVAPR